MDKLFLNLSAGARKNSGVRRQVLSLSHCEQGQPGHGSQETTQPSQASKVQVKPLERRLSGSEFCLVNVLPISEFPPTPGRRPPGPRGVGATTPVADPARPNLFACHCHPPNPAGLGRDSHGDPESRTTGNDCSRFHNNAESQNKQQRATYAAGKFARGWKTEVVV